MIKYIYTILIIVILSIPVGCSWQNVQTSLDAAEINADYNLLVERYDGVRDLVERKWQIFDTEDQEKLLLIDNNAKRIIDKIDTLRSKEFYKVPTTDLAYMYTLAKDSYLMSKEIYIKYESTLTRSEAFSIKIFDQRLQDMDEEIKEFLENPNSQDFTAMAANILTISSTALKIILPLAI